MRLRYDEDFVEEAVLLCATGRRKGVSSLQIARFNRERERLYAILDPDERNTAFFALHLEWFREWGLERSLAHAVSEFPVLRESLGILAFRKSRGKNDDGTELYVNEAGERSGVLAMRPERLSREAELGCFLRHELGHLHDMVDSAFGYEPELPGSGPSVNQQRLARERYRLLWDVTIDGRLSRGGRNTIATRDERRSEFGAAFAFWSEARQVEVFQSLWNHAAPTHQMLVSLVCDSRRLQTTGPGPGAPCPLCGFPTFVWAAAEALAEQTTNAIRTEFPQWTPDQGVCARCATIYRVNRPQVPAVL
jgi:hypothetical protein